MTDPQSQHGVHGLLEQLNIGEDDHFEAKLAQGGIPKSVWSTISAFANTSGGIIALGLEERGNDWIIQGVPDPDSMMREL